ncbi:uncharacterized protein LOC133184922 [Saccostrea echinata]|uniref:uncharacterized protein LOC133184922 n=1 Tax=Saccostrea echinata TaxID=191078 RepID=UPI002A7F2CEC|nr:uncharacterized protein LOC133184922 [Saccostrea echinata]
MDKVKEEAERYSGYVREKLGDILSSAVADVAKERPEDPIDYLAHRLYNTATQRNTATCAARTEATFSRPAFTVLKPRHGYGTRVTKSRLSRCRLENEMSLIQVKSDKKKEKNAEMEKSSKISHTEKFSPKHTKNSYQKLGLDESGQLPIPTEGSNPTIQNNVPEIAGTIRKTQEHEYDDNTSQTHRGQFYTTDDEGFEDSVLFGNPSKPVFVHQSFKHMLRDVQCDLFDDNDLT